MSRKKKGKIIQHPASFNPMSYLKSGKARSLPIDRCLIPDNWKDLQKFPLIVVRKHINGNVTVANLLVDLQCTGIKDAMTFVNMGEEDLLDMVSHYESIDLNFIECEYNLAHNIIYEALAYAEDFGISPHPEFPLAELILEPDTDDIPIMDDIPLGLNGRPTLFLTPEEPRNNYFLAQMKKNAGEGNFDVVDHTDFPLQDEFYDPEDYTIEDWVDFFNEIEDFLSEPLCPEIHYIYEKCIYEPEITQLKFNVIDQLESKEIEVNSNPLPGPPIKESEKKKMIKIYERLKDPKTEGKKLKTLIEDIHSMINTIPNNPALYNYLHSAYNYAGKKDLADKVLNDMERLFPDYLFGKIQRAVQLIEDKKEDKVPAVFNYHLTLPDLFPDRKTFHVQEFTSFHNVIGRYYLAKNDLLNSFTYFKIIRDMEVPEEMLDVLYLTDLDSQVKIRVMQLIEEIRNDPEKEEEVLTLVCPAE